MNEDIYKPPRAELFDDIALLKQELDEQANVLASGFRMVVYGAYLLLLATILFIASGVSILSSILAVVAVGSLISGVVTIGIGKKNSVLLGLFYLMLFLVPMVNVVFLTVLIKRTASELRKKSYRVNFWGVSKRMTQ